MGSGRHVTRRGWCYDPCGGRGCVANAGPLPPCCRPNPRHKNARMLLRSVIKVTSRPVPNQSSFTHFCDAGTTLDGPAIHAAAAESCASAATASPWLRHIHAHSRQLHRAGSSGSMVNEASNGQHDHAAIDASNDVAIYRSVVLLCRCRKYLSALFPFADVSAQATASQLRSASNTLAMVASAMSWNQETRSSAQHLASNVIASDPSLHDYADYQASGVSSSPIARKRIQSHTMLFFSRSSAHHKHKIRKHNKRAERVRVVSGYQIAQESHVYSAEH